MYHGDSRISGLPPYLTIQVGEAAGGAEGCRGSSWVVATPAGARSAGQSAIINARFPLTESRCSPLIPNAQMMRFYYKADVQQKAKILRKVLSWRFAGCPRNAGQLWQC